MPDLKDALNRFKGRLLHGRSSSGVPQIPTFCVQREDIRIPMPSLWPEISPSSFHQTNGPNHSPHSEFGNKSSHLSGRHSNSTPGSQGPAIHLQERRRPSRRTGIPYQPEEVLSLPITAAHISGNYSQHCNHVSVLAAREAQHNSIGCKGVTVQGQFLNEGVSSTPPRMAYGWHLCTAERCRGFTQQVSSDSGASN